jgi:hypothetical protein
MPRPLDTVPALRTQVLGVRFTLGAPISPGRWTRHVPSEGAMCEFDSRSGVQYAGIVLVAAQVFGKDLAMVRFHLLAPITPTKH